MYGVDVEAVVTAKRGRHNEVRQVGMYLIKELCDLKLQEIADRFGKIRYGAVGWACHGVASRMQSDSKFRSRLDGIRRNCQQKT
jgi:chromosomal replication initiation ATPase DnaA